MYMYVLMFVLHVYSFPSVYSLLVCYANDFSCNSHKLLIILHGHMINYERLRISSLSYIYDCGCDFMLIFGDSFHPHVITFYMEFSLSFIISWYFVYEKS